MIIDLAVLNTVMTVGSIRDRGATLRALAEAFQRFDPGWEVGSDDDDPIELVDALRVVARDQRGRFEDLTDRLREKLGWEFEDGD